MKCIIFACERGESSLLMCKRHYERVRLTGSSWMEKDLPVDDKFWSKVEVGPKCWEWTGGRTTDGYGSFFVTKRQPQEYAHRISYELANGKIPPGLIIDHMCHNRGCVRPDHLRAVTYSVNSQNFKNGERKPGRVGYRGVTEDRRRGTFFVRCRKDGRTHSIYGFADAEEAAVAAIALRKRLGIQEWSESATSV